ncbi:MAG TPA: lytic transglycosylase domain-containing protein [Alphaproteobacteria bacterium]|nr:lytic transglycosylase domain-containing protein [Alphaproteobacteria bacterium]
MNTMGLFRGAACALLVLLLAACGGGRGYGPAAPDPSAYGRATSSDPWGPYIRAASDRFDVPEAWIRTVMEIESSGRTHLNGRPITSHAGAMGLMQLMPTTFDEVRRKHDLGSDPHDPWTNILAGTAYLREMYDLYGVPGFFAAYNCGPGCYGEYLAGRRTLPAETRNYLAKASALLDDSSPRTMIADATPAVRTPTRNTATVHVRKQVAPPQVPTRAVPAEAPVLAAAGAWGIQVGAFSSAEVSGLVAEQAQQLMVDILGHSQIRIVEVPTEAGTLYRARLVGITESQADDACRHLIARGGSCIRVAAG